MLSTPEVGGRHAYTISAFKGIISAIMTFSALRVYSVDEMHCYLGVYCLLSGLIGLARIVISSTA